MFGKDKVKGHSRLIKGKLGFKITRIRDFLRKKDDSKKRNIAIGTAAATVIGAGGIALLLRKKGVNINSAKSLLKKSTKVTPKQSIKESVVKVRDIKTSISDTPSSNNGFSKEVLEKYKKPIVEPRPIVNIQPKKPSTSPRTDTVTPIKKDFDPLPDPWDSPLLKPKMRSAKLLVKKPVTQNRLKRKDNIPDPWNTPIKYNLKKESSELLVKKEGIKLLSPAKVRDNLLRPKSTSKRVAKSAIMSAKNMERTQEAYNSLPTDMKAIVQIEKALVRPIKTGIGRPPDTKGLKTILDDSDKTPIEKVISKAKRKVADRLKRQNELLAKRETQKLDNIVPNASRRGLLGVDRVKTTLSERDKLANIATNALAERKSPMGRVLAQINKIAKDPEAEKLGIQVKAEEWENALAQISGRREMIKSSSRGATKAAQSLAYARIVKPKIIKTLMNEVKSGNLQATNPKGYAERLKRIHDNFDELMVKEGSNYRELSRRELGRRVGQVMKPEIDDAVVKAKDFATSSRTLTDTFLENGQMQEAFKQAGITDRKAQFAVKMLMKLGGLG